MNSEYVHVGRHADILASCRHVAPGERVSADELDLSTDEHAGEDQHLVDEGRLVLADGFTGPSNAEQVAHDEPAPAPVSPLTVVPAPATIDHEEDEHGNA